jgi:hypothetical protein
MEENKKQYLLLLSEIIAKEAVILGPDMAILKARSAAGLSVDNNGNVTDIDGDAAEALQELTDGYAELSGQAAKDVIDSIFIKYPQIHPVK